MRGRALLLLLLPALVAVGTASATHVKVKHVRMVRHVGPYTATLTYTDHPRRSFSQISDVRLRVAHGGRVVLRRKICQPHMPKRYRCDSWGEPTELSVARVGPHETPAFVVSLWTGGNTCCQATYLSILARKTAWVAHIFSFMGAGIMRRHGQSFFAGTDGRFYCAFSVCASSSTPIQIWGIDASNRFVDVTRRFPRLIRKQARFLATGGGAAKTTIRDQGAGILAPWCADEYLLGDGEHCARVLAHAVKRHWPRKMTGDIPTRGFVRSLNRELVAWGYKRS